MPKSLQFLCAAPLAVSLFLTGCGGRDEGAKATSSASATRTASAPASGVSSTPTGVASQSATSVTSASPAASGGGHAAPGSCQYEKFGQAAKPVDPPPGQTPEGTATLAATVKTSEGTIAMTLDREKSPCTVNNFESLARQKFFDGVRCHRLVTSGIFVLQCGDPSGKGTGGPGYRFADELTSAKALAAGPMDTVIYPAGSVAMANSGPDTNGSQFFLVFKDTPLPASYTLFGQMDKAGLGVVTQIADMGVKGGTQSEPIAKATIESVTLG